MKSSYCIFAVRPENFHFSSLKKLTSERLKKILGENYKALTFALPIKKWVVKKGQKIFESLEATALEFYRLYKVKFSVT